MSYMTNTARFDEAQRALTEDELRQIAPSIFSTTAHPSRSDKFAPIATIDVLREMAKEGFGVVGAQQSLSRRENGSLYAKHMLRIRQFDGVQKKVDDCVFEAYLKNANDGTGAYEMLSGIHRIRCLNSCVAMAFQMETHKIRHAGLKTVAAKVIDATYRVVADADRALEAPDKWSRIQLGQDEQMAFAKSAHIVRFGDEPTPIVPEQLLDVRREGDQGADLWTVFNRVQENSLRGGLHATRVLEDGRRRRMQSRPIKAIDSTVHVNRALWTLAEEMAALKAAA